MSESVEREASIFGEAVALPSGERTAYLNTACAGDAALRRRVDSLLRIQEKAGTFFEGLERETRTPRSRVMEEPGKWIDRYLLLEQIGEGGCGVVYRAEQEKPVQRQVALKIIKLGMDTKQVVARFEAERQALALMDHPHIARVLDAGATETGRPYFVMELVRGTKITDYCEQHQLTIHERLDLFIQACRAIQHAHQKGVIHRDIKPSNILVTIQDGMAFPKVIDFGIAKATQGRLTNRTVFTAVEQFIGTPAYMSPEQADLGGIDIDTRSDIYSLGVLLYELLTSHTPFASKALVDSGIDEMRRTIRFTEPTRPSVRLAGLEEELLGKLASHRRTDSPRLMNAVRGDLDWIVIKSLEKERSRRYATVNAFIRDIERHLASEPVTARPPSQVDRFRKVIRRNKIAFAAGTAVFSALVLGLGLSTWLFLREKDARRQAQSAREEQEQLRLTAEKEAMKSRELADSLQRVLQRLGPAVTKNRAELQRMLEQLTPEESLRPESAALLRMRSYLRGSAGRFAEAVTDLDRLIEMTPDDAELWHWRAALLVHERQYDAWKENGRRSSQRFIETRDRLVAERIAKDSLMLPAADLDHAAIDRLVDAALQGDAGHSEIAWFQLVKGMSEYRKGNYDASLEWLRRILLGRHSYVDSQALLVMAMAAHRAKHPAEANAALDHATAIIDRELPKLIDGEVNGSWVDRIFTEALAQEARAVLNGQQVELPFTRKTKD